MGKFGAPGERSPLAPSQRLKALQTLILEPSFVEKITGQPEEELNPEDNSGHKFVILPRWEQRFLGLRQRKCGNRIVLACRAPADTSGTWLGNHFA